MFPSASGNVHCLYWKITNPDVTWIDLGNGYRHILTFYYWRLIMINRRISSKLFGVLMCVVLCPLVLAQSNPVGPYLCQASPGLFQALYNEWGNPRIVFHQQYSHSLIIAGLTRLLRLHFCNVGKFYKFQPWFYTFWRHLMDCHSKWSQKPYIMSVFRKGQ